MKLARKRIATIERAGARLRVHCANAMAIRRLGDTHGIYMTNAIFLHALILIHALDGDSHDFFPFWEGFSFFPSTPVFPTSTSLEPWTHDCTTASTALYIHVLTTDYTRRLSFCVNMFWLNLLINVPPLVPICHVRDCHYLFPALVTTLCNYTL